MNVEPETLRVPELKMPPPANPPMLPEIKELETARVPRLFKPAPLSVVFAPETVMPEIERLPPEAILNILKLREPLPLLPLMTSDEAPGPVMTSDPAMLVAAIVGSEADPRVIVLEPFVNSEAAKTISSLALFRLESVIACLNEPAPASAVVVTVY